MCNTLYDGCELHGKKPGRTQKSANCLLEEAWDVGCWQCGYAVGCRLGSEGAQGQEEARQLARWMEIKGATG